MGERHRQRVAQHRQGILARLEVARCVHLDRLARLDDAGGLEGAGPHGHAAVDGHRDEVHEEAHPNDRHAGEVTVGERHGDEHGERQDERNQRGGAVEEHRQRVQPGADREQPDLVDARSHRVDPRGSSCQPRDQPRRDPEREHDHGQTVPSPLGGNGDRYRPGPWPTNASRRCATRSMAPSLASRSIGRSAATHCRGRWSVSSATRSGSPRPTMPCAWWCSPARERPRSARVPTSRG